MHLKLKMVILFHAIRHSGTVNVHFTAQRRIQMISVIMKLLCLLWNMVIIRSTGNSSLIVNITRREFCSLVQVIQVQEEYCLSHSDVLKTTTDRLPKFSILITLV